MRKGEEEGTRTHFNLREFEADAGPVAADKGHPVTKSRSSASLHTERPLFLRRKTRGRKTEHENAHVRVHAGNVRCLDRLGQGPQPAFGLPLVCIFSPQLLVAVTRSSKRFFITEEAASNTHGCTHFHITYSIGSPQRTSPSIAHPHKRIREP